jgi:hypothetical protein
MTTLLKELVDLANQSVIDSVHKDVSKLIIEFRTDAMTVHRAMEYINKTYFKEVARHDSILSIKFDTKWECKNVYSAMRKANESSYNRRN